MNDNPMKHENRNWCRILRILKLLLLTIYGGQFSGETVVHEFRKIGSSSSTFFPCLTSQLATRPLHSKPTNRCRAFTQHNIFSISSQTFRDAYEETFLLTTTFYDPFIFSQNTFIQILSFERKSYRKKEHLLPLLRRIEIKNVMRKIQ